VNQVHWRNQKLKKLKEAAETENAVIVRSDSLKTEASSSSSRSKQFKKQAVQESSSRKIKRSNMPISTNSGQSGVDVGALSRAVLSKGLNDCQGSLQGG
jgi:hypothetical protein